MPNVFMANAMMYTSSTSFLGTWNSISNAIAYYSYKNADGSVTVGSGAQAEMCRPMSMKGKVQGLTNNNELRTGNDVVTTCTAANTALWP